MIDEHLMEEIREEINGRIDIKRAVTGDKRVTFEYFRDNALWYRTEDLEIFPVPITDIGTATFKRSDKAILFMRWMRKYNEKLQGE